MRDQLLTETLFHDLDHARSTLAFCLAELHIVHVVDLSDDASGND